MVTPPCTRPAPGRFQPCAGGGVTSRRRAARSARPELGPGQPPPLPPPRRPAPRGRPDAEGGGGQRWGIQPLGRPAGAKGASPAPPTCTHTCRPPHHSASPRPQWPGAPEGRGLLGAGPGAGPPRGPGGRAAGRRRGGRTGGGTQGRRRPERARCGKPAKRGQRRGETGKEKWRDSERQRRGETEKSGERRGERLSKTGREDILSCPWNPNPAFMPDRCPTWSIFPGNVQPVLQAV